MNIDGKISFGVKEWSGILGLIVLVIGFGVTIRVQLTAVSEDVKAMEIVVQSNHDAIIRLGGLN